MCVSFRSSVRFFTTLAPKPCSVETLSYIHLKCWAVTIRSVCPSPHLLTMLDGLQGRVLFERRLSHERYHSLIYANFFSRLIHSCYLFCPYLNNGSNLPKPIIFWISWRVPGYCYPRYGGSGEAHGTGYVIFCLGLVSSGALRLFLSSRQLKEGVLFPSGAWSPCMHTVPPW